MSEATKEPVADIVRDMRAFAKRHWMHDEGQNIGLFADRIEAAHKQELLDSFGNAAAMRRALELLLAQATEHISKGLVQIPWPLDNACKEARAALEARPRNCDRFETFVEAHKAWFDWAGDKKNCDEDGVVKMSFGRWLMAEAEQEGSEAEDGE